MKTSPLVLSVLLLFSSLSIAEGPSPDSPMVLEFIKSPVRSLPPIFEALYHITLEVDPSLNNRIVTIKTPDAIKPAEILEFIKATLYVEGIKFEKVDETTFKLSPWIAQDRLRMSVTPIEPDPHAHRMVPVN